MTGEDYLFIFTNYLSFPTEAKRMEEFCRLCENSGAASDLGILMDASHSSLRDLYQCSHPDLEELVALCKREGAYGCKLTGAGYILHIVYLLGSNYYMINL